LWDLRVPEYLIVQGMEWANASMQCSSSPEKLPLQGGVARALLECWKHYPILSPTKVSAQELALNLTNLVCECCLQSAQEMIAESAFALVMLSQHVCVLLCPQSKAQETIAESACAECVYYCVNSPFQSHTRSRL
jgi:hypothetical protein